MIVLTLKLHVSCGAMHHIPRDEKQQGMNRFFKLFSTENAFRQVYSIRHPNPNQRP